MDSGDDSSSDDSGSNTGHDALSATTPTCAVSPSVSGTNEGKMEHTVIGGEGTGGPIASALNLQVHQDSSWLNIDYFPGSGLVFEDNIAKDKCQKMGNIEDKSRSDGTKDDEPGDGSQKMDHNMNGVEDGPGDEDGVEYGGEDIITDPEMNGIEVDGDGSRNKGGHGAGVGGGTEGWYYSRAFFVIELTLQSQGSRIRSMIKWFKLQRTPIIVWSAGVSETITKQQRSREARYWVKWRNGRSQIILVGLCSALDLDSANLTLQARA